jgi:hypothetical protein
MQAFIEHDGVRRYLGCLPPHAVSGLPTFRDRFRTARYGQTQLQEIVLDYDLPILDQGQSQACGGYSASEALTMLHAMRSGGEVVQLSPTYVYSKCNGGRDAGVAISDLLAAAKRYGDCEIALFPENCLYVGQGDPLADQCAQRYRLEEGFEIQNPMDILMSLAITLPVVMGIMVGDNFGQVDAEGISPRPTNYRGGHALLANEVYYSDLKGWCIGGPNTWGSRFGRQGRYRVAISDYFADPRFGCNAFAVQSLIPDPDADGPHLK